MLKTDPGNRQLEVAEAPGSFAPLGPMLLQPMPRSVTLLQLLPLVWRHLWLVVLAVVASMIVAFAVTRPTTRLFVAEGSVVVASRKINVPQVEMLSMPVGDVAIVRSEMAMIRSRTLLSEVARKLELDRRPEFNPTLEPPQRRWFEAMDPRPYFRQLMSGGEPSGAPVTPEIVQTLVEEHLANNLELLNDTRDYVITLRFRSRDPRLSAAIVNAVIDTYLAQNVQSNMSASSQVNSLLETHAAELRSELAAANAKVEAFVQQSGLLETRNGSVGAQQLDELNTHLSLARAERVTAEARYQAARGGVIAKAPDVLASPLIHGLREKEAELLSRQTDTAARMGPDHPDRGSLDRQIERLRGMIGAEIAKVQQSLKDQVDIARARETNLAAQVAKLEQAARVSASSKASLDRLRSDADAARHVLDDFLVRAASTTKPGDQQLADVRIVSRAVPPIEPAGTRTMFFTALAGVIGFLGSVCGVLAYERLDHGFESLADVGLTTGVPGLAAIPGTRRMLRRLSRSKQSIWRSGSPVAETLRGLRARLYQGSLDRAGLRSPRTILVTSALPREGKTSLAIAFAQVAAGDGRRVLLLDCDLRRSGCANYLKPSPGSTEDALGGARNWRDCVGIDTNSGLHYILAQRSAHPRVELLEGKALAALLAEAASVYELVMIDAPPVMRVPDALMIAAATDAVIVVTSWHDTPRRTVLEALRRLRTRPDTILGVVLTKLGHREAARESYIGYG